METAIDFHTWKRRRHLNAKQHVMSGGCAGLIQFFTIQQNLIVKYLNKIVGFNHVSFTSRKVTDDKASAQKLTHLVCECISL